LRALREEQQSGTDIVGRTLFDGLEPARRSRRQSGVKLPHSWPALKEGYQIMVTRGDAFASQWGWEICRDGRPLPARLRKAGFKSERTASAAARAALRDFLAGLAHEETKPD
jgi:hypothetical protein